VLATLGWVQVASAGTWFVAPVDTSNSGEGSFESPWRGFKNIKWGVRGIKPGDTLYLMAGFVYHETLEVKESGKPGLPITLGCDRYQGCTIDGEELRFRGITGEDISHLEVNGIVLRNHKNSGVRFAGECSNIVIRGVKSNDNDAFGIYFHATGRQMSDIVIESNEVSNNGRKLAQINRFEGAGIFLTSGTNGLVKDVIIRNNYAFDNEGVAGIMVYPSFFGHTGGVARNIIIKNNAVYCNGGSGIDFSKRVVDSAIAANIAWGNGTRIPGSGIHVGGVKEEFAERIEIYKNVVKDQHFVNTDGAGILVDDFSLQVAVYENSALGNEGAGIKLHNCRRVIVQGNLVQGNGSGVLAPGANDYAIIENRINCNLTVGIRVYPGTTGAYIAKNYLAASPVGLREDRVESSNEIINNIFGVGIENYISSPRTNLLLSNNSIEPMEQLSGVNPCQEY